MTTKYLLTVSAIILITLSACSSTGTPSVAIREAELFGLPGANRADVKGKGYVDCNSPAHWDGETIYVFQSAGAPYRSHGPDLFHLSKPSTITTFDNQKGYKGHRWIESTYKADDGTLYGWYHREPGVLCPSRWMTAPQIGAAVSTDNGMNWRDLGLVLRSDNDEKPNCETANTFFGGGNGDFSVIIDRQKEYFYFFISTYNNDPKEQGVSVARIRYADRDNPVGKVFKWHNRRWKEPGLSGHITPVFPAAKDWHSPGPDVFWGASIHFNTYLKQYVILMNRAKDEAWAQEGIYATFNRNLANPQQWSKPVKILDASQLMTRKWYPQVIGINKEARQTDKLAGQVARLLVAGKSKWEIVFYKPGDVHHAIEE